MTCEGVVVSPPFHRLLMMHKPKGVVCERTKGSASWRRAHGKADDGATAAAGEEDTGSQASVYDCLPAELDHASLGTFGRLDKDTTGLFLLGSDGGLQVMLLHPSTKFEKTYIATLDNNKDMLVDDAAERFEAGVEMPDGTKFLPAKLEVVETCRWHPADDPHAPARDVALKVRVTCVEGQYHQVKKLLGACGGAVCALHRESMGPLKLDPIELPVGQTRLLTMDELRAIKELLPPEKRGAVLRRGEKGASKPRHGGDGGAGGGTGGGGEGLRRRRAAAGREGREGEDRRRRGNGNGPTEPLRPSERRRLTFRMPSPILYLAVLALMFALLATVAGMAVEGTGALHGGANVLSRRGVLNGGVFAAGGGASADRVRAAGAEPEVVLIRYGSEAPQVASLWLPSAPPRTRLPVVVMFHGGESRVGAHTNIRARVRT